MNSFNPKKLIGSAPLKNLLSRVVNAFNPEEDEIVFQSNGILTLGVEVELQMIDPANQRISSRAEEILKLAAGHERIKPEFYLNQVEINTAKCRNVQEIEKDLSQSLDVIAPFAEQIGVELMSTATHPFTNVSETVISPSERYLDLIDRNQWIARRMTVNGLHIHIGMESGDDCIRFNNFFIHFLPHLLALSASSPFWQGIDTGLASCRPSTYEALPTAGQPYKTRSWRDFEHLYHTLKKCGSIKKLKDLWWDLRPSPSYGTLEIRVCDGPATLYETTAITAFVHCLAHWFNDHGSWLESVAKPPTWLTRENKWRAMRHGLEADLVLNSEGKTRSIRQDILEWIEKLKPYTRTLGYTDYMSNLEAICRNGNSSERQRKIFNETNSLEEVVKFNIAEFKARKPNWI